MPPITNWRRESRSPTLAYRNTETCARAVLHRAPDSYRYKWRGAILVDDDTERSKREVEAEAVAYVVGRYCGLDTSGSAFYLAAWESDDPEIVRDRLDRISSTAEELIDVLEDGA